MDRHSSLVEQRSGSSLKEREELALEIRREYESQLSSEDFNLNNYIDVFLRKKWLIIACLVTSVSIVTITTLRMVPIYKSEAIVEITPEPPRLTSFKEIDPIGVQMYDLDEYYETQYRLLKSKSLGRRVSEALGLFTNVEVADTKPQGTSFTSFFKKTVSRILSLDNKPSQNAPQTRKVSRKEQKRLREEAIIDGFVGGISVLPDRKSRLVRISYDSPNPAFAAKSVNTLIDTYIEWVMYRKINATKMARSFLRQQVQETRARLETAEKELSEFARSADIVSLDADLNLIYSQLVDLNKSVSKAEKERIQKESRYKDIQNNNYGFLPEVNNDRVIVTLNEQYTNLAAEYQNKSVIYGPNYPAMKQLRAQMRRIDSERKKRTSVVVSSLNKDYETSVIQVKLLKTRAEEQKRRASRLNEESIQYRIHLREVETNKAIYQTLLQRQKETEVISAIRTTNVMVVDYAVVPTFPYKPNMRSNLMYGVFLGLVAGCSLAFMLDYFDNTIKDEEEIKRNYALPFLGSVPLASKGAEESLEKAVYMSPKSPIAEAFRVIRTSLLYSTPGQSPKAFLVTSSQPLEGKTTTSCNLALSILQAGHRVILVDSDLRKPRLHKIFMSNQSNAFGLSTYLTGNMELEGVIRKSDIEGLDIITSGPIPPNPAELLGSLRLKELIDKLGQSYDQIILDGPPIGGFADSRLLSMMVDGVLIVTSVGITQRQVLRNSIEEIFRVRGKILGTIVNRLVPTRGNKYGYGYYYYTNDESVKGKKKLSLPRRSKFFSG